MKFLPRDVSDFSRLIRGNYLYVDKTHFIARLYDTGERYHFLSRPRRFGKSLFISMLKEYFLGHKELFAGLWIAEKKEHPWPVHPVIHLDFSTLPHFDMRELRDALGQRLITIGRGYGVEMHHRAPPEALLYELITVLAERNDNDVVVLIDEYDKPLLDHLKDPHIAQQQREVLKSFYDTLKGVDAYLHALFVTGVTKFSNASIFSGLNNLADLSMYAPMSDILGYTQGELEHYFPPYIERMAECTQRPFDDVLHDMQQWYNGYRFSDLDVKVYNPFSVLCCLAEQRFKNYWFTSGTPSFLVELIKKDYFSLTDLEQSDITGDSLGAFDVRYIPLVTLLFQTGHLTIRTYDTTSDTYTLAYPNHEVQASFVKHLLAILANTSVANVERYGARIAQSLERGDLNAFVDVLRVLLAHIPYHLHMDQERYYHSLFQFMSTLLGLQAQSEVATDKGRIDLVIYIGRYIYLFEFKYNDTAERALKQIDDRAYFERFLHEGKQIILVGLSFNRTRSRFSIEVQTKFVTRNFLQDL